MDEPRTETPLLQGRFTGRAQFQQLVRDAVRAAACEGWREIVLCDPNFEDWPLGERAFCDDLQVWARPGRRFVMLAGRYDEIVRRHARFVGWRTTWSHLIDCRVCRDRDAPVLPSVLLGPTWSMRRLELVHDTGVAGAEPERRLQTQEALAEWLRRSAPAFPSSILGL